MINIKFVFFRIKDYFVHKFKIGYRKETIYYIGGSDTFPPPLTQEEESAVISELGREKMIYNQNRY